LIGYQSIRQSLNLLVEQVETIKDQRLISGLEVIRSWLNEKCR